MLLRISFVHFQDISRSQEDIVILRAHAFERSPSIKRSPAQEIIPSKDLPLKRLPSLN